MAAVIPKQYERETIWELWERDFSKAQMSKDKKKMERIWLKAFLTSLRFNKDIDPNLRVVRYMEIDHHYAVAWGDGEDKDVRTDVISAWLGSMAEWSRRTRTQTSVFRR